MEGDVEELAGAAVRIAGADEMNEFMSEVWNLRRVNYPAPGDGDVVGALSDVNRTVLSIGNGAVVNPNAFGCAFAAAVEGDGVVGADGCDLECHVGDDDVGSIDAEVYAVELGVGHFAEDGFVVAVDVTEFVDGRARAGDGIGDADDKCFGVADVIAEAEIVRGVNGGGVTAEGAAGDAGHGGKADYVSIWQRGG